MELLNLKFVLDFLAGLAKEYLSKRITPETSDRRARRFAFAFYQNLERTHFLLEQFLNHLEAYYHALEKSPDRNEPNSWLEAFHATHETLAELVDAVEEMISQATETIPQFSVYAPEIIKNLRQVHFDRSQPLPEPRVDTERLLRDYAQYKSELELIYNATCEELEQRLSMARKNAQQIEEALNNFRVFLREQWSFKEAF